MPPRINVEEERQEQILTAAAKCFAVKGYHRTTMDDIVREARLSKGGIYWYFKSKQEIFRSLLDKWFNEMVIEKYEEVAALSLPAKDKIERFLNLTGQAIFESLELAEVMMEFWAETTKDNFIRQTFKNLYLRLRQILTITIQEGIDAGEFRKVNALSISCFILGSFDGLVFQWLLEKKGVEWEKVIPDSVDFVLSGLAKK